VQTPRKKISLSHFSTFSNAAPAELCMLCILLTGVRAIIQAHVEKTGIKVGIIGTGWGVKVQSVLRVLQCEPAALCKGWSGSSWIRQPDTRVTPGSAGPNSSVPSRRIKRNCYSIQKPRQSHHGSRASKASSLHLLLSRFLASCFVSVPFVFL
jgi:hypothetical protein